MESSARATLRRNIGRMVWKRLTVMLSGTSGNRAIMSRQTLRTAKKAVSLCSARGPRVLIGAVNHQSANAKSSAPNLKGHSKLMKLRSNSLPPHVRGTSWVVFPDCFLVLIVPLVFDCMPYPFNVFCSSPDPARVLTILLLFVCMFTLPVYLLSVNCLFCICICLCMISGRLLRLNMDAAESTTMSSCVCSGIRRSRSNKLPHKYLSSPQTPPRSCHVTSLPSW